MTTTTPTAAPSSSRLGSQVADQWQMVAGSGQVAEPSVARRAARQHGEAGAHEHRVDPAPGVRRRAGRDVLGGARVAEARVHQRAPRGVGERLVRVTREDAWRSLERREGREDLRHVPGALIGAQPQMKLPTTIGGHPAGVTSAAAKLRRCRRGVRLNATATVRPTWVPGRTSTASGRAGGRWTAMSRPADDASRRRARDPPRKRGTSCRDTRSGSRARSVDATSDPSSRSERMFHESSRSCCITRPGAPGRRRARPARWSCPVAARLW